MESKAFDSLQRVIQKLKAANEKLKVENGTLKLQLKESRGALRRKQPVSVVSESESDK
jgi:hypothetical protein